MINSSALLEINKKNFIYNYNSLKKIAKRSLIGATIKANAYGLGDLEIFDILYKNNCRHFFVATFEEALKIRTKYIKGNIYVLNGINKNQIKLSQNKKIIPIINSIKELKIFSNNNFIKTKIGIHIDTGINRLGIKYKDLKDVNFNKFNITLLLSHLASADEIHNKYNMFQLKQFSNSIKYFQFVKYKSLINSVGTLLDKKYHYDLTRPGISLYGGHFNTKLKKLIKPVVKLKAKVLQIKKLEKNEYVGYNQTYKASNKKTIGILGIGYADGISRKLSNKGKVFFKNKKFSIIGRVSMDSITVDITKYKKKIREGTYMELINYKYDIEKLAKECNTISNEILTSISPRVKRIYK